MIQNLSKMLIRLIGEDVAFEIRLHEKLWRVCVDPGQVEQIIMNLAVNARDAMPRGGRLLIETHNTVLDDHYCEHHLEVKPGQYVLIMISDTGVGMDKTTRDHLFEPFFTTKEKSKGTGLGLPMVYGIVKQSEGHIQVYSELDLGTTFKIYFPRVSGDPRETVSKRSEPAIYRSHETILIIEDDANVRRFVIRALVKFGFSVLEAHDFESALRIVKEQKTPIHLILSDVIMPKMNGPDIVKELKKYYPQARVLYMSGYNDDIISHQGILNPNVHFIQKPFVLENLIEKIRNVLDINCL